MEEETLRSCIGRIVRAKEAMNASLEEVNDLRLEVRSEGINLEALDPLVHILSRHPHDRGVKVLTDLARYARVAGTELGLIEASTSHDRSPNPSPDEKSANVIANRVHPASASTGASFPHSRTSGPIPLVLHGTLAVSLSLFLVWLLR